MKVYGQPNLVVTGYKKLAGNRKRIIHLFTFDKNGIAEIDENNISKDALDRVKQNFKVEEKKDEHRCKKCDHVAESHGKLLAHYRKSHKEE